MYLKLLIVKKATSIEISLFPQLLDFLNTQSIATNQVELNKNQIIIPYINFLYKAKKWSRREH